MKKTIIYVLIVALLGGLSWYLINRPSSSTMKGQMSNFAVSDTASITKIFLADKSNNSLTLERKDENTWILNEEYVARKDMVDNLLRTIKLLKVRTPVPKTMHDNAVRRLASTNVKVEIYQNNEENPMKVYYVGGPNKDHTGSFMLLENSSVPYVMHLEGHYGYLSSRYSANKYMWRNNYIWQFPGKNITNIASIQVINHGKPEQSFTVEKVNDNTYQVLDAQGNPREANAGKVLSYVKRFESVAFEGYEETKAQHYMDSVVTNLNPWHTIVLNTVDGLSTKVTTWPKPMTKPATTLLTGESIENDMDRLYMVIDDKKMVIGQHFTFGPLTIDANFFDN